MIRSSSVEKYSMMDEACESIVDLNCFLAVLLEPVRISVEKTFILYERASPTTRSA